MLVTMKKLLVILGIVTVVYSLFVFAYIFDDLNKPKKTVTNVQAVQQPELVKLNADTIFNLVNAERAKNGLQPLIRDARLDATAQSRADDMVARDYFGHNDPATGENLVNILNGIEVCKDASENIISVDDIGEKNTDALKWWMNSKPHHDAILDTQYDLAGMAVNGDIGVMHFCNLK